MSDAVPVPSVFDLARRANGSLSSAQAGATSTTAPYWVLIACSSCLVFHHYRPTADNDRVLVCTRAGGYKGCGRTIRLADVPAPADGDTVAVVDGVLQYGIDPAATFTYSHVGEFGWPRTFTAPDLALYLREICVWQQFVISRALIEAARDGVHDYECGYGVKSSVIRNNPA